MIAEQEILTQIKQLPDEFKREALHYIEFLKEKAAAQNKPQIRKNRCAGSAAGKYTLAPDFDEPLADFEEYM